MRRRLDNPGEAIERNLRIPNMMLSVAGWRQSYLGFLQSPQAYGFRQELVGMWDRIGADVTDVVIDAAPGIDDVRREFFRATLAFCREYILLPACEQGLEERGLALGAGDVMSSRIWGGDVPGRASR
ncbi:hypothetical protein [Bifidobacterium cuniculi]|nr:hypothetical protein [Bifidobacterium cuniculi]